MATRSRRVEAEASSFAAVYRAVDLRSGGQCEVHAETIAMILGRRCARRAVDHHHLYKPRRAHHTADQVIHACRPCHDRMDWPFKRGRLCYVGRMGTAFLFAIRYASDKAFRA